MAAPRCGVERPLREVFELDARVLTDPVAGTPLIVPIGRRNRQPTDTEVPAAERSTR